MIYFNKCLLLCLLAGSGSALGAWASGGGELLRDARNPWFIQNTTDVTYCVRIDPAHFHQTQAVVEARIGEAIAFWKDEFSQGFHLPVGNMKVGIATQAFHLVSCAQNPDITFQMGVLDDDQIQWLGDPTRYVSIAVRTHYDSINLKGRGFVYVGADSGPLKPVSDQIAEQPWSMGDGGLLYRVLVHELGHVFGLPDTSEFPIANRGTGMMSASYPEYILNKQWAQNFATILDLPNYFKFTREQVENSYCHTDSGASVKFKFYGIPKEWQCMHLVYKPDSLEVYARKSEVPAKNTLIGRATLTEQGFGDWGPEVYVWLPPEQKVFPNVDPSNVVAWGPQVDYRERKGIYRSADGSIERQVFVSFPLNGRWGRVRGILDDKLLMNVNFGE